MELKGREGGCEASAQQARRCGVRVESEASESGVMTADALFES